MEVVGVGKLYLKVCWLNWFVILLSPLQQATKIDARLLLVFPGSSGSHCFSSEKIQKVPKRQLS
jgi:hypothetical protein